MYTSTGLGPLGRSVMEDTLNALAYHRAAWPGISKSLEAMPEALGGKVPSLKENSKMELGYRDLARGQAVPAPDSWLVTTLRKWLRVPGKKILVTLVQGEGGPSQTREFPDAADTLTVILPAAPSLTTIKPQDAFTRNRVRVLDGAELLIAVRERLDSDELLLGMIDDYNAEWPYAVRVTAKLYVERKKIVLRLAEEKARLAKIAAKAAALTVKNLKAQKAQ